MTSTTADYIHRHEGRQLFGLNPAGYDNARPDYPAWIFERLRVQRRSIGSTRYRGS